MGESERASGAARLGAGFGVALLVCAVGELAVYASPALADRGGFFDLHPSNGAGPLHLVFAVALGVVGFSALALRLPPLALFAVVPSLAVAAAEGGFNFYLAIRSAQDISRVRHVSLFGTTLGTWGGLAVGLVGGVLVVIGSPRMRTTHPTSGDVATASGAIACAAALTVALVVNRFAIVFSGRIDHRFGALFFGVGSGGRFIDEAAFLVHGVIILVAVAGSVLLAGALGRTRAASLLLVSAAFGALLFDNFWLNNRGPYFSFLPAFWLLISGAVASALLAVWCWLGEQRARPAAGDQLVAAARSSS